jgi:transposase
MGSDEQFSGPILAHDDFALIAPAGQKNRKDLPSLQTWVMLDVVYLKPNTEPKPRRQVMKDDSTFIGMDVHKNSIDIAIANDGRKGQVRHYGKIDGSLSALDKVVQKLTRKSKGRHLNFVYEAGPCGYQIYRHLSAQGHECVVVAPSRVPKQSGNRIKNDRRDALMLARLHRAGELSPVYVPQAEDEAMRDLTRAREDAKSDEKKSKQRLLAFLLRSGHRYTGSSLWSKAHMNWLADIKMTHRSQQVVFQEYIDTVNLCKTRVQRLTDQIRQLLPEWRLAPVVYALQSLRGVSLIVASTTVAELGDLKRFDSPVELMSYLGLVPSEHSSGQKTRRGSITKAGNAHVRRMLVESAWTYRFRARVTRELLKRQRDLPQHIRDIAWKAQLRLCARYRHLWAKGKTRQVVVTAVARELCAFIWAIANQVEVQTTS